MKSIVSISFVIIFLIKGILPGIDLGCELQKLPNLFSHYQQHKACNDDSFWQFFTNDFLDVDGTSEAHHDDMNHEKLPFQGNHQCCHVSAFYPPVEHFSVMVLENSMQARFCLHKSLYSHDHFDSPFQPPKFDSTALLG